MASFLSMAFNVVAEDSKRRPQKQKGTGAEQKCVSAREEMARRDAQDGMWLKSSVAYACMMCSSESVRVHGT